MKKEDLIKIYKLFKEIIERDKITQEAFTIYTSNIAPSSYPVYIEKNRGDAVVETLVLMEDITGKKGLVENLLYWFYENKEGENNLSGSVNDVEYNFSDLSTYLDFCEAVEKNDLLNKQHKTL